MKSRKNEKESIYFEWNGPVGKLFLIFDEITYINQRNYLIFFNLRNKY